MPLNIGSVRLTPISEKQFVHYSICLQYSSFLKLWISTTVNTVQNVCNNCVANVNTVVTSNPYITPVLPKPFLKRGGELHRCKGIAHCMRIRRKRGCATSQVMSLQFYRYCPVLLCCVCLLRTIQCLANLFGLHTHKSVLTYEFVKIHDGTAQTIC